MTVCQVTDAKKRRLFLRKHSRKNTGPDNTFSALECEFFRLMEPDLTGGIEGVELADFTEIFLLSLCVDIRSMWAGCMV